MKPTEVFRTMTDLLEFFKCQIVYETGDLLNIVHSPSGLAFKAAKAIFSEYVGAQPKSIKSRKTWYGYHIRTNTPTKVNNVLRNTVSTHKRTLIMLV